MALAPSAVKTAESTSMYGAHAETSDLWAAVVGDRVAAATLTRLGRKLRTMGLAQLEQLPNLGPVRAAKAIATIELARRILTEPLRRGAIIRLPQDLIAAYGARLMDLERESVWAVYLTVRNRIVCDEMIALGSITSCSISPGDLLRPALRAAAPRMIMVHSHPNSGDPRPSTEDDALTRRLVRAAKLVDVELVDHIVIGEGGAHYSYAQHDRLTR